MLKSLMTSCRAITIYRLPWANITKKWQRDKFETVWRRVSRGGSAIAIVRSQSDCRPRVSARKSVAVGSKASPKYDIPYLGSDLCLQVHNH